VKRVSILLLCSVFPNRLRRLEFKNDPAIVGGTFTGIKLSLTADAWNSDPDPGDLDRPRTFYRIGGDRTVEVMAGDATGASLSSPSSPGWRRSTPERSVVDARAKSEASMTIKAGEIKAGELTEKSLPAARFADLAL
jgi:hypothetical protein